MKSSKAKVKLINRKLWKEYYAILSGLSTIASLLFLFLKIPEEKVTICFLGFTGSLIAAFLIIWFRACNMRKAIININNSILEISLGDIFTEKGYKIIAFNEYFDTQVDDTVISNNSLNGKYITRFFPKATMLDKIIAGNKHLTKQVINKVERNVGKTLKYKLGTIVKNDDFFLLAFSHFDENNRAYLEINDYINCLLNMWNECDILYGGNTVVLPLLGSGITRFPNYKNVTDQELLEIIIWTFKMSSIRFHYPNKLKIVLTNKSFHSINLYDIRKQYE